MLMARRSRSKRRPRRRRVCSRARACPLSPACKPMSPVRARQFCSPRNCAAPIDHAASDALLRDIGVLRQAGRMVTTANDVRLRADLVLLIGQRLTRLWPDLAERLALGTPPRLSADKAPRKIFWLGGEPGAAAAIGATEIAASAEQLPQAVAALRAAVAGRKSRLGGALAKNVAELAGHLQAAHFGAFVWSAETLDALTIEALTGLVVRSEPQDALHQSRLRPGAERGGRAADLGLDDGLSDPHRLRPRLSGT